MSNRYFSFSYCLITWLLCITGCTHRSQMILKQINTNKQIPHQTETDAAPAITIWIHGTILIRQSIFFQAFGSKTGLKKTKDIPKNHYINEIGEILNKRNGFSFPLKTLYAFGWSGKLSGYERLQAAQYLYDQLITIIKAYVQKYGIYPKIRIITHSHGGNVALNLAFVEQLKKQHLKIDTLLLLACPVQESTMHFSQSPIFDKVYSLYSSLDTVQILAPQLLNERLPFSDREFPRHFNVLQAKVRLNEHAIFHTEFTSRQFIGSIPSIIHKLEQLYKHKNLFSNKKLILRINTRQSETNRYKKMRKKHYRFKTVSQILRESMRAQDNKSSEAPEHASSQTAKD